MFGASFFRLLGVPRARDPPIPFAVLPFIVLFLVLYFCLLRNEPAMEWLRLATPRLTISPKAFLTIEVETHSSERSHPTVGVPVVGLTNSVPVELLTRGNTIGECANYTSAFVSGLAHRSVGRGAQTNAFEGHFLG